MCAFERRQSPLFAKTEEFTVWLFRCSSKFPKQYRHTLTEKLENGMLEFQRSLGAALYLKEDGALRRADLELWMVKRLLRLACELHVVSSRQLTYAMQQLEELGRLLGSWIKKGTGTA